MQMVDQKVGVGIFVIEHRDDVEDYLRKWLEAVDTCFDQAAGGVQVRVHACNNL